MIAGWIAASSEMEKEVLYGRSPGLQGCCVARGLEDVVCIGL